MSLLQNRVVGRCAPWRLLPLHWSNKLAPGTFNPTSGFLCPSTGYCIVRKLNAASRSGARTAVSCQLSASLVAPAMPNTACSPGELVSKHVYYLDELRDSAGTWRLPFC